MTVFLYKLSQDGSWIIPGTVIKRYKSLHSLQRYCLSRLPEGLYEVNIYFSQYIYKAPEKVLYYDTILAGLYDDYTM